MHTNQKHVFQHFLDLFVWIKRISKIYDENMRFIFFRWCRFSVDKINKLLLLLLVLFIWNAIYAMNKWIAGIFSTQHAKQIANINKNKQPCTWKKEYRQLKRIQTSHLARKLKWGKMNARTFLCCSATFAWLERMGWKQHLTRESLTLFSEWNILAWQVVVDVSQLHLISETLFDTSRSLSLKKS